MPFTQGVALPRSGQAENLSVFPPELFENRLCLGLCSGYSDDEFTAFSRHLRLRRLDKLRERIALGKCCRRETVSHHPSGQEQAKDSCESHRCTPLANRTLSTGSESSEILPCGFVQGNYSSAVHVVKVRAFRNA